MIRINVITYCLVINHRLLEVTISMQSINHGTRQVAVLIRNNRHLRIIRLLPRGSVFNQTHQVCFHFLYY